jgi:hypothetical protein
MHPLLLCLNGNCCCSKWIILLLVRWWKQEVPFGVEFRRLMDADGWMVVKENARTAERLASYLSLD